MPIREVWLTSSLQKLFEEPDLISNKEKEAIAELLSESIDELAEALPIVSPVELARDIHGGVDKLIQVRQRDPISQAKQITCRKGCAHCCSQIVASSDIEAKLLAHVMKEQGLTIDRARLERQAGRNDASWLEQSAEDRTCVFLGPDNTCRVYEHRPASCRKYFSISDPSLCDLTTNPEGRVSVWFALYAEMVTSAMFTACTTGFLPDLLLAELRREP